MTSSYTILGKKLIVFGMYIMTHIKIDGSYGEGGGRNFRDTIVYAMMKFIGGWKGKVTINNIRASRPKPGVKNSLFGVVDFCNSLIDNVKTEGITDGSLTASFDFSNATLKPISDINLEVNGIGSAWLLFLAVHPVLQHVTSEKPYCITIHGGTDVCFKKNRMNADTLTPPSIYMKEVWAPNINNYLSRIDGEALAMVTKHFDIDVKVIRHHKDRSEQPYAIKMTHKPELTATIINIDRLTKFDGKLMTVRSSISGLVVGSAHPYYAYPALAEPNTDVVYDEHYADMIVPYLTEADYELAISSDIMSEHHQSAIYVRGCFQLNSLLNLSQNPGEAEPPSRLKQVNAGKNDPGFPCHPGISSVAYLPLTTNMPKNAFSALALSESEDDSPVVTQPAQTKSKRRVRIDRAALHKQESKAPPSTPERRPPQASTMAPRRPVYRRNAQGQLVNATTGEVLIVGPRRSASQKPPPKMDAFPMLGGKQTGPTKAIQIGAWGNGIKAVVDAKNLPDPAIAERKAREELALWLKRQQAASMTGGSYYDSEDDYEQMPEGPTDEELMVMREREEQQRNESWEQTHQTFEPTADELAAIALYEQEQADDWWGD
jgi:hypothetical protein